MVNDVLIISASLIGGFIFAALLSEDVDDDDNGHNDGNVDDDNQAEDREWQVSPLPEMLLMMGTNATMVMVTISIQQQ